VEKLMLKIVLDIYPMRSYLCMHVDYIYDNNLPCAVVRHGYYIIKLLKEDTDGKGQHSLLV